MKTILHVILILMISDIASYAQKVRNLDEMNEKKRNEYLIKKTKKVVMRFIKTGYYRRQKTPVIKRVIVGQNDSISAAWMLREHKGRVFYAVYLRHDPEFEYMHSGYAACVFFGQTRVSLLKLCSETVLASETLINRKYITTKHGSCHINGNHLVINYHISQ